MILVLQQNQHLPLSLPLICFWRGCAAGDGGRIAWESLELSLPKQEPTTPMGLGGDEQ